MKDIIDVSRYQGNIDWDKLAGKIGGAMLKTVSTNKSFGGIYIDPMFETNYAACKRLGIPVGVYYYTYAQGRRHGPGRAGQAPPGPGGQDLHPAGGGGCGGTTS